MITNSQGHIIKKSIGSYIFRKSYPIYLLLLPFFEPIYVSRIESVYYFYLFAKIIATIIVLYIYAIYIRRISILLKLIICLNLCLFISTLSNSGDMIRFSSFASHIIVISMIIELWINKNPILTIKALYLIINCLSYLNIFGLLYYPDGLYIGYSGNTPVRYNFLGLDNQMTSILLPGIVFGILYSQICYNKIKPLHLFNILIMFSALVYVDSTTAIIGSLIVFSYLLFRKNRYIKNVYRISVYRVALIVLFIGLIFFKIQYWFSFIIVDLFGKTLNFSDRLILWEGAIKLIKDKPFLGHGIQESDSIINWAADIQKNAHNQILYLLINGGLLTTSLFILIFYFSTEKLLKFKNEFSGIIGIGIFAFFLMFITEVYQHAFLIYALFTLAYNTNKITEYYYLKFTTFKCHSL